MDVFPGGVRAVDLTSASSQPVGLTARMAALSITGMTNNDEREM